MPKDKTVLTKSTPDKYFIDYGTKINFNKIPYPLKDIIGYDEIEATAGLALAMLKLQDKPLLKQRNYMSQAMVWKTAELLKQQRFTRYKNCKSRWVSQAPVPNTEEDADFFSIVEAPDGRDHLEVLNSVEGLSLREYAWLYHRFIVGLTRAETVKLMKLNTYTRQVVSTGARRKIRKALTTTSDES